MLRYLFYIKSVYKYLRNIPLLRLDTLRFRHQLIGLPLIITVISMVVSVEELSAQGHKSGEALIQECKDLSDKFDYAGLYGMAQSVIAAGERERNERISGYGYVYLGGSQLMLKEASAAAENLRKAIEIGEKIENDTILSTAYNSLGIYEASVTRNLFLAQRYFYKSRQHAVDAKYSRIERSIGSNLAELAIELNDTSGIKYARECYDYGVEASLPRFEYSGAINLAELYKIKGDYELADRYATIAMNLAIAHGYHDLGQINLLMSIIAFSKGDYKAAQDYAVKAIEKLKKENTIALPKAYLMLARSYSSQGRYADSLLQLKLGEDAARKYSSFVSIGEIYELMSENYDALGQKDNALRYLRLAKDSTDSHYRTDRKRMEQERSLILDLEDKDNKMRIQNVKVKLQSRLILSLSAGVLLLIIMLVIVVVNHHKQRRLYKNLVEQNKRVVALRDELLNTSVQPMPDIETTNDSCIDEISTPDNTKNAETTENPDSVPERISGTEERIVAVVKPGVNDQKADILYARLCRLMKEDRLFADPGMTREEVIERLGTNRTYLTQIISKHGWTNYSHFVNSFRIDEAIRILSDKNREDVKMRDLYSELGFGSQATFYKTFSSFTGMSPVMFRKSVK